MGKYTTKRFVFSPNCKGIDTVAMVPDLSCLKCMYVCVVRLIKNNLKLCVKRMYYNYYLKHHSN